MFLRGNWQYVEQSVERYLLRTSAHNTHTRALREWLRLFIHVSIFIVYKTMVSRIEWRIEKCMLQLPSRTYSQHANNKIEICTLCRGALPCRATQLSDPICFFSLLFVQFNFRNIYKVVAAMRLDTLIGGLQSGHENCVRNDYTWPSDAHAMVHADTLRRTCN